MSGKICFIRDSTLHSKFPLPTNKIVMENIMQFRLYSNTVEKCVRIKLPKKLTYTFHRCEFCVVNTHNSCTGRGGSSGGAESYLAHQRRVSGNSNTVDRRYTRRVLNQGNCSQFTYPAGNLPKLPPPSRANCEPSQVKLAVPPNDVYQLMLHQLFPKLHVVQV